MRAMMNHVGAVVAYRLLGRSVNAVRYTNLLIALGGGSLLPIVSHESALMNSTIKSNMIQ